MRRVGRIVAGWIGLGGAGAVAWAAGGVPAPVALAAGGAAAAGTLVTLGVASMSPSLGAFGPAICRAPVGHDRPEVALTFDDGPDAVSTERLCDALDAVGARATFFLLADRAAARPDLVARVARSHEVALHGASHDPWLTVLDPGEGSARLAAARDALAAAAGRPVRWFRPPFGATSPRLCESVRRAGLTTVWCSVRPHDAGPFTGDKGLVARIRAARQGDIVLMHEGDRSAARVLPTILAELGERGLRAVTVGELLA